MGTTIHKSQISNRKKSRRRKANVIDWIRIIVLFAVVAPLFLFQVWSGTGLGTLERAKRSLLEKPSDVSRKIELAQLTLDAGDLDNFDLLARDIPKTNYLAGIGARADSAVLGTATARIDELLRRKELSSTDGVNRLIEKWQDILKNYSGYRDAYLQLAALYVRVKDHVSAKEYLQAASELDPNSEKVAKVRKIVESRGILK